MFIIEGMVAVLVGVAWLFVPRDLEGFTRISAEEVRPRAHGRGR